MKSGNYILFYFGYLFIYFFEEKYTGLRLMAVTNSNKMNNVISIINK